MRTRTEITWLCLIVAGLLLSTVAVPPLNAQSKSVASGGGSKTYRKIDNKAFTKGEEFVFDVNYGFVTAGEARMSIPRYTTINGRQCFGIEFNVKSKPFFDNFYKVRDHYETHVDVDGLFPWKFVQQIREGGYSRDFSAWFDQGRHRAMTTEGQHPIPPFTQDILSAFYFMRTYNYESLKPGQQVYLKNFYRDSTYTLTIKFIGKETIEVAAGNFRTVVLEPIMKEGGLFKSSGRLLVWLTDDERKMPVQVKAEIPIGSIKAELTSFKGVQLPIRGKIN
jgi:hypothetical protein